MVNLPMTVKRRESHVPTKNQSERLANNKELLSQITAITSVKETPSRMLAPDAFNVATRTRIPAVNGCKLAASANTLVRRLSAKEIRWPIKRTDNKNSRAFTMWIAETRTTAKRTNGNGCTDVGNILLIDQGYPHSGGKTDRSEDQDCPMRSLAT